MAEEIPDFRLAAVYELLRSVFERHYETPGGAAGARQTSFIPPPPPGSLVSATDLLTWWFRPATATADPWDDYFTRAVDSLTAAPRPPRAGSTEARSTLSGAEPRDPRSAEEELTPWTDPLMLVGQPGEEVADEDAQAAVECVYEFIHAIGRREGDRAMTCVAPDYHVLENDREIDAWGVRSQIESLLDSMRGWALDISLAEIPQPVFHPNGILIYVEIQIDAYRPQDDLRRSTVDRRIAVLQRSAGRDWLIDALSRV